MNYILHQKEKRQFERLLKEQLIDRIDERVAILEVFLDNEEHLSIEEWSIFLKRRGIILEDFFLAETFDILVRFGLAIKRNFEGGNSVYEHCHLGEHHDHFICSACGEIIEFHDIKLEALQERLAKDNNFLALRHKLQIYGICNNCLTTRRRILPLFLVSSGERVCITKISGEVHFIQYLIKLGLSLGTKVEVINNSRGQVVLAVRGARLALSKEVVNKILVTPV